MSNLFENNRTYVLGDPELELLGDREKLAQWRHKGAGPAYYKLGRKVVYRGSDLNVWVEARRVDPGKRGHA
ncbi:MerR family transcriptional regulator [Rhodobacteraceae bacterium 4F10]|nr:MerR family transcriptional regulator [Rhodobacteraceae bacterium 4F10]